jgi:hypothetical protein
MIHGSSIRYNHGDDFDLVSHLLRDHLAMKLTQVFLENDLNFNIKDIPIPTTDDMDLSDFVQHIDTEFASICNLKKAWQTWSLMDVNDRLFIIESFHMHLNIKHGEISHFQASLIFCKFFLKEFIPILSMSNN